VGNRGTIKRGKAFESANFRNLGGPDLDDQVSAVQFLGQRDYVDASRVGIWGHSYGGYLSALGILSTLNDICRRPERMRMGISLLPA